MNPMDAPLIRERHHELHQAGGLRQREQAQQLGISEAALLDAYVGAPSERLQVRRLTPEWPNLIASLEGLGDVMALTRNSACVHEKIGTYRQASHQGAMGLVLDAEIDLRIFYGQWAHGFAVTEAKATGEQLSLQFFDAQGQAIHKVFARDQTDLQAWAALLERFVQAEQHPSFVAAEARTRPALRPDTEIDAELLLADWDGLQDTHDFFGMLRRHQVERLQAMRLAEGRHTERLALNAARHLLDAAAIDQVSIMVFVGNPGMIQIHTGTVHRVEPMGPWLNVMDPRFNLHLREDWIDQIWCVRKPTSDGVVTSVELFDAQGETIAMFFGERKPGKPEREDWRALVATLPRQE